MFPECLRKWRPSSNFLDDDVDAVDAVDDDDDHTDSMYCCIAPRILEMDKQEWHHDKLQRPDPMFDAMFHWLEC